MPKPKACIRCEHFKRIRSSLYGECKLYNWMIMMELAKTQAVCKEYPVHHVFPEGRKAPIPLYIKKQLRLKQ